MQVCSFLPCLDFASRVLAPRKGDSHLFHWEVAQDFPLPTHVQLVE